MRQGYGDFIKKHRISSGYKKQITLAEKTGISAATISRIEKEVQKPEVRTLQTLAQVLHTTSYVDLMVACGYWNEDDLLENESLENKFNGKELASTYIGINQREQKETPASYEEEFLKDLDLAEDELVQKYNLKIDGQPLTDDETKGIIAYIRSLRQMKS